MDFKKVLVHDRLEMMIMIQLSFPTNSLRSTTLDPKIHLYMSITILRDV